jgi:hypothetical protein
MTTRYSLPTESELSLQSELAQADPHSFWVAADTHERANGRTYTELQIALPRELDPAQRQELAREATRELLRGRFAYDRQRVIKSRFFKNPMHRSGLALAGAQTTIEAWKREEVPPVENDGILTAEDVSTLDLQGTWLVTLSACDTGSGQVSKTKKGGRENDALKFD